MADNHIAILIAIQDNLQRLEIPSTRKNMDTLLGCIQALDRVIEEEQNQNAEVHTDSE